MRGSRLTGLFKCTAITVWLLTDSSALAVETLCNGWHTYDGSDWSVTARNNNVSLDCSHFYVDWRRSFYTTDETYSRDETYAKAEVDAINGATLNTTTEALISMRGQLSDEITQAINALPTTLLTDAAKSEIREALLAELTGVMDQQISQRVEVAKAELVEALVKDEAFIRALATQIEAEN